MKESGKNQVDVEQIMQEIRDDIKEKGLFAEDIEQIVQEIRDDIKRRGLTEDATKFESIPIPCDEAQIQTYDKGEFLENLGTINQCYQLSSYHELHSDSFAGKILVFIKKVVRKMVRFYTEPIVQDQSIFNASTVRCMNQIYRYMEGNQWAVPTAPLKDLDDLQKKIERLQQENVMLRQENAWLRKVVEDSAKKAEAV